MKLLLDTHVLIWWWFAKDRVSATARSLIEQERNSVLVSAATGWEIATKQRIGKLPALDHFRPDFLVSFLAELAADRFSSLPVSLPHGLHAGHYAIEHGDPFDRILAAQSELEAVPLITRDPAFSKFPCRTLW